ncbi:MAG TPA: hypothetical protein VFG42_23765 [Baekduia sp.]|uniref:hypothetical protein n=1 Tax=Baekduia sp. TaxID=2600305 RepID=UPI002D79317D|nr:hypothetical protein [Baekduia sp.]HET6509832.1 hypothetical protein [Baekduia sp.]
MADSITFLAKDDEGQRILDELEQQTDLRAEAGDEGDTRVYPLEDEEHRIEIVQTLTDIDPEWSEHLALQMPA